MAKSINERLQYLREQIEAESISWGEVAELEGLAEHIPAGDVQLLEWAGVPETVTCECSASYRQGAPHTPGCPADMGE